MLTRHHFREFREKTLLREMWTLNFPVLVKTEAGLTLILTLTPFNAPEGQTQAVKGTLGFVHGSGYFLSVLQFSFVVVVVVVCIQSVFV